MVTVLQKMEPIDLKDFMKEIDAELCSMYNNPCN